MTPKPIQSVVNSPIFKNLKQKLLPKINKSVNSTKMPQHNFISYTGRLKFDEIEKTEEWYD